MNETKDPYKFDRDLYWERKKQGLHGTVHPPGSKEQRYDTKIMKRKSQHKHWDDLRKGLHERKDK